MKKRKWVMQVIFLKRLMRRGNDKNNIINYNYNK